MDALSRSLIALSSALDRKVGWDRLPLPLGLLTLEGIRTRLRKQNLYDTGLVKPSPPPPAEVDARTLDGSYNDLTRPAKGSIGTRFGRNVPLQRTFADREDRLLDPDPRRISRELLTRERFIPATTLNVLAAAWIQFEVHDWFSHQPDDTRPPFELPLDADDPWPQRPMRIKRTQRDPDSPDAAHPAFLTYDTHWWDASQIYGTTEQFASAVRSGEDGKLRLDERGLPPKELQADIDLSGVAGNFWLGLGLLHTLFMHEHNAICDRLRREYPTWTDDRLYRVARLINAALMAKIHTVEWTPAIVAHPTTVKGMNMNWYGLAGQRLTTRLGRIGSGEVLSGIPGSPANDHGVPYSLTEEFVAVYRMHPLLPDDFTFRAVGDDSHLADHTFRELGVLDTRKRLEDLGLPNALYSFGIAHPGAITLHNYPRFLQTLERADGEIVDLAATDIVRVRERGVPRYTAFRELFHRTPVPSFEELTRDAAKAAELRRVYGRLDRLDLMVGLWSEPLPRGFGFSDTTFRVFVLMASRRLKSDRFFTNDYRPGVYTQAGLDWINATTMKTVILRHYPELQPVLRGVDNAFKPWPRVRVPA
jgi:Animal haem peroxidase